MAALFILAGALLTGTALGALTNWVLLRRKLLRAAEEWRAVQESLRSEVSRIAEEWRERDQGSVRGASVPNGFNMNRRPDAVRRLHAGMQIDRIATGTGWSIPEIALLQKIERLAEAAGK